MATSFTFGNKRISIPGTYLKFAGNNNVQALPQDYGNVLILDSNSRGTAIHAVDTYIDEANILDSLERNTFSNLSDYRNVIRGGIFWELGESLFAPSPGASGASNVTYALLKGKTPLTAPANGIIADSYFAELKVHDFHAGAPGVPVNPIDLLGIRLFLKQKGLGVKSSFSGNNLISGYRISRLPMDENGLAFALEASTYRGQNELGFEYDQTLEESTPEVLYISPRFKTLEEFELNVATDNGFKYYFDYFSYNLDADAGLTIEELFTSQFDEPSAASKYAFFDLPAGGDENTGTSVNNLIDAIFDAIKSASFDFVFLDVAANNSLVSRVKSRLADTDHKPDLWLFGGTDQFDFESASLNVAKSLNSEDVILVHGGVKEYSTDGMISYFLPSIYLAAKTLGRTAGLPPHVPPVFKEVDIKGLKHNMKESEKTKALKAGVLSVTKRKNGAVFEILKGVNTLQKNSQLINADGSTHSVQIKRIKRQMSKELIAYFDELIRSRQDGPTSTTFTDVFLVDKTKDYLRRKIGTLLTGFNDASVQVRREQDARFISFEAYANGEISFIFITPTLSIPE